MEIFPTLRCLSRKTALCLYFIGIMFAACTFFTLYLDSRNNAFSSKSVENIITFDDISSGYAKPSEINAKVLQVSPNPQPEASVLSSKTSNNSMLLNAGFSTSNSNKSAYHNTVHADTKYVYLNITSRPFTTPSNSDIKMSTTEAPSDTCQASSMKDAKLILLWTPFFDSWDYLPKKHFKRCSRCRNCHVTKDRSRLEESDAVIFHARDMSLADLPSVRYPRQRWVFYCLESPPYSDFPGMQYMKNMFNWTMTYRADSDIVTQYGTVSRVYPSRKLDLQYLEWVWSNKSRSVAWMSSHCPTHGGRDPYVEELKKYIDVDVYGSCGTVVCPPGATEKCLQDFTQKYKFFLAFENTICKDYITEKFFRTLNYDIVPVVFGGAEYEKFAPPGSFVNALSFKSPKHLAFFLAGVGKNFKLYSNYFRWRKDYSVTLSNNKECVLCSLLHKKAQKPFSYQDLREWWVEKANCRTWEPKR